MYRFCDDTKRSRTQLYKMSTNQLRYYVILSLMTSGDVARNPGPQSDSRSSAKPTCVVCERGIQTNCPHTQCCNCERVTHTQCVNKQSKSPLNDWLCTICALPKFTDSIFNISQNEHSPDINSSLHSHCSNNSDETYYVLQEIKDKRLKHLSNLSICHLNINSFRYKFYEVKHLLADNIVDIASFSETKLNSSLPDAQFQIDNFTMYRSDRTRNGGGGIITYVHADIPSRRQPDLEKGNA